MRQGTVPKRHGINQERVATTSQLPGLIPGHKWNLLNPLPNIKNGKFRGSGPASAEERVVTSPIQYLI